MNSKSSKEERKKYMSDLINKRHQNKKEVINGTK